jgi:hypothetical protein
MSQQHNESGSCPEVIDTLGYVDQAKTWLLNALGTFTTTRLLTMIAERSVLIAKPVIKELIRASENKMLVKGGYDEIWNHDFRGKVWPHFAEEEIVNRVNEGSDEHTSDLKELSAITDLYDTFIHDNTTWQRLFEQYVRLFRVPDPPRVVRESMDLIKQTFLGMPENFFESSKVLLERGSVNEDNTLTVSRVLETNASKTFEVLANGLFSQRDGNVEFILQSPTKLRDLAYNEALTLEKALPKAPELKKNFMSNVGDFTNNHYQTELRHIRLQYGTFIGLFAFREIFPNFQVKTQYDLMSVRGNIVSVTGTDAVKDATFMRMPAASIGLQGFGMWLKPTVSDDIRKKLYKEAHPQKLEDIDETVLSVLIDMECEICEILKRKWQEKAHNKKIPDTLSPKVSDYYSKCQEAFNASRADDIRWLFGTIETLGNCQSNVRKDLEDLKIESKGLLWK